MKNEIKFDGLIYFFSFFLKIFSTFGRRDRETVRQTEKQRWSINIKTET